MLRIKVHMVLLIKENIEVSFSYSGWQVIKKSAQKWLPSS